MDRERRQQHEQRNYRFLARSHVLLVFHSFGCSVNDWRVSILLARGVSSSHPKIFTVGCLGVASKMLTLQSRNSPLLTRGLVPRAVKLLDTVFNIVFN